MGLLAARGRELANSGMSSLPDEIEAAVSVSSWLTGTDHHGSAAGTLTRDPRGGSLSSVRSSRSEAGAVVDVPEGGDLEDLAVLGEGRVTDLVDQAIARVGFDERDRAGAVRAPFE